MHFSQLLQWSSRRPMKSTECLLNGDHNLVLKPGTLYVLKIMPVLTCNTHIGQYKVEGSSTSIMIITGKFQLTHLFAVIDCFHIATKILLCVLMNTFSFFYILSLLVPPGAVPDACMHFCFLQFSHFDFKYQLSILNQSGLHQLQIKASI